METLISLGLGLGILVVALAGHLCGFRFGLPAVGPFGLIQTPAGLRFRWLPPSQWGPFAMACPDSSAPSPSRLAWHVAGGPLASALIAAVAAAAAVTITGGLAHRLAVLLALLSLSVCAATVQPSGTGTGIASDGGRLLAWLRNPQSATALAALLALEGRALSGIRPREWEPELVHLAARCRHRRRTPWRRRPRCFATRWTAATLRRLAATWPGFSTRTPARRVGFAALWSAGVENDTTIARLYLRDAHGSLVPPFRRFTAAAAVAILAGQWSSAREVHDKAAAAVSEEPGIVSTFDLERREAVRRGLKTATEDC